MKKVLIASLSLSLALVAGAKKAEAGVSCQNQS